MMWGNFMDVPNLEGPHDLRIPGTWGQSDDRQPLLDRRREKFLNELIPSRPLAAPHFESWLLP